MTQEEAMKILKMGHPVYLTGPPGSGKTFLLNQYIDFLKQAGVEVGVTASTGIAATHMNGITIHSWSGIGIKDELSEKDLQQLSKKRRLKKRFRNTKVLIIDEISMLHAHQLDLVNQVIQTFKGNHFQPFGDIQLVLCGDFFQLPPVTKNNKPARLVNRSQVWNNMNLKVCYLTEQWRQTDSDYLTVLNDIRTNAVDDQTRRLLQNRYRAEINSNIKPIKLYTHNIDVDKENERELAKIQEKPHRFVMRSEGPKPLVGSLKQNCLAPEQLVLKVKAPVIFVKNNFREGYVNGTLGKVVDFEQGKPVVETMDGGGFLRPVNGPRNSLMPPTRPKQIVVGREQWSIGEEGTVKAEITQFPLRLAWAITVHKSQGMSLDAAEVDLSKCFEPGMGYVALSRVRSLAGVRLIGLNKMALQVNNQVLELDRQLKSRSQQVTQELQEMSSEQQNQHQTDFLNSIGAQADNDPDTTPNSRGDADSSNQATPKSRGAAGQGNDNDNNKAYSVEEIRKTHPRAYKKWTSSEEQRLIGLYKAGRTTNQLAHTLGRQPGAIRSRLRKLREQDRV